MALSDIVNVTITTLTTAPTRVGFGTPLVMAFHTVFPERFRIYTSTTAMISDGFTSTDAAVRAVGAILSQNPKVNQVIVGRAANAPTQTIVATVASVENLRLYEVTINGVTFDFTSDSDATNLEIAAGLVSAISLGAEPVTATDNVDGTFDLVADVAGDLFTLEMDRLLLTQDNQTVDPGIVPDIQAVQAVNDDWYSLHLTSLSAAEIGAAAIYIETQIKLMVVSSADDEIPTSGSGDIGTTLKTAGFARTALMYHPKAMTQYAGAAWAGKNLPQDPGSITWKFKTLAAVDSVSLTPTEVSNLEGKNVNHYTVVAGIAITQQGISSSAEFIDVTRGVDFIRARLQEFIFARLANAGKVPFTDRGVAIIEAEVRAVMELAIGNQILASDPAPVITVPLVADVPFTDRAARLLPDVDFTATLAGAIHSVEVNGVISV